MVEKRYLKKKVNLEEFKNALKKLFKENGYSVKDKGEDTFHVKSSLKKGWHSYDITIKGEPEDFKVSIVPSNFLKFMLMGIIGVMFDNITAIKIMKSIDELVELFAKSD